MTRPANATELREGAEAIAADQQYPHPRLAAALVAALADLTVVERGRTANAGSYSYSYADIADVVKMTRPVLARHGVVALTPVHGHGDGLACTVTFLHESGDRMDMGPFPFPHGRDAQATGSMVTYHRRYALTAALGIAAGDDDDGAGAKPRQPESRIVWTAGHVKAALVNLLNGKDEAKAAWDYASGDELTEFSQEVAQRIADAWLETADPSSAMGRPEATADPSDQETLPV